MCRGVNVVGRGTSTSTLASDDADPPLMGLVGSTVEKRLVPLEKPSGTTSRQLSVELTSPVDADVIMGAIGHQNNDMHLAKNARKAKIDSAAHIAQKAGLKSLKEQTSYGRRDFEIWRFQFSKKPKK